MMNERMVHPWEDAVRASVRVKDADPAFARRLREDLMRKAATTRPIRRAPAMRPLWIALTAALALLLAALLIVGPEKVVAALQTLLGYLPDIGFVQMNEPFRVLEHPLKEEKSGATLYILQVLAAGDRTVVVYEVDCPGPETRWLKTGSFCADAPALVLPGGARLEAAARTGRSALPYFRERAEFAALPADVAAVEFHLPFRASPGAQAEDWIVRIALNSTTESATIYPVIEITPSASPAAADAGSDPLPEGIGLTLERVVALEGDVFLQGSVDWDPRIYSSAELDYRFFEIVDGGGALCPWEFADPDPESGEAENRAPWAVRFNPRSRPGPFRIRAGSIFAEKTADSSFEMDFGSTPRIGQTWPLNIPLRAADYNLRVTSARIESAGGSVSVVFSFEGDAVLIGAIWRDAGATAEPFGYGEPAAPGIFESGAAYPQIPAGRHTIRLVAVRLQLRGNWIIPDVGNFQ